MPDRLADVLCWRDERYVGNQLAFSYDRQRIILAENEITRGLPGKYVDSYEYPVGRLEFRWKGVSLPYSLFDKDQRVTHTAITENKHLSAVLEHIKAEQDKAPPKKRRAGQQRSKYKPTGRRNDGWNSLADRKRIAGRKASQGCDIYGLRPVRLCSPQRQGGTFLLCGGRDISTWLQQNLYAQSLAKFELRETHQSLEGYLVSATVVRTTYFYASVCRGNPDQQKNFPVVGNYQKFSKRMDVSEVLFNEIYAKNVGEFMSLQVIEAMREIAKSSAGKS